VRVGGETETENEERRGEEGKTLGTRRCCKRQIEQM
jgi:hypothetical protein